MWHSVGQFGGAERWWDVARSRGHRSRLRIPRMDVEDPGRWVCGRCGSRVVFADLHSRGLRPGRRLQRPPEPVPHHCSNPECVYFDPRRVTFGWYMPAQS